MQVKDMIEFDTPDKTTIQVFYQKGDDPFISAVNGPMTLEAMVEISQEVEESIPDTFNEGDGDYLLSAVFNMAQTGEFGRIEIPAHWELDILKFRPIKEIETTEETGSNFGSLVS